MNIWRLTISTDANPGIDARKFCIERSILGLGWPVEARSPLDWATYEELGTTTYYDLGDKGWWPAANAIHNRMKEGDLCWTRDWGGQYYIGRVEGPWEYRGAQEYRDADVVNVRACRWVCAGTDDSVPGKVLNSFRASRTLQAVHDDTVRFYSKLKFNQAGGKPRYDLSDENRQLDLFSLISPEDCEDIVGIYLQEEHGYRLVPSTCRHDTAKTEFVLRKQDSKALVQVKQGQVTLDRGDFQLDADDYCEWFLFTTGGYYEGKEASHIHCLNPKTLLEFAFDNVSLMSDRVQQVIRFCVQAIARDQR